MVRLVVDASVARSCGDNKATYPIAIQCRDFLIAILGNEHEIVMTPDIKREWDKHQSRFALTWLRQMIAKKRLRAIPIPEIDPEIWNPIEAMAKNDSERSAMTKDILLLEAALATDRRIVSLDEKTARQYFKLAAREIEKIQTLVWVNPSKPEEKAIEWLQAGAPADKFRMLGCAESS
jgi:hypothetical protein